jgi:hypothetical protein
MRFKIAIFSGCLILSGCSGSVQDYVTGVTPPNTTSPSVGSNGPMALKVSPGRLDGTGTGVAVSANVTATNQFHQAGDISVRLTISRTRVTAQ